MGSETNSMVLGGIEHLSNLSIVRGAWVATAVTPIPTDVVYAYFNKALDSANHTYLPERLQSFGLSMAPLA